MAIDIYSSHYWRNNYKLLTSRNQWLYKIADKFISDYYIFIKVFFWDQSKKAP